MSNTFDINRQRSALRNMLTTLPDVIGDMAVNFYKARFRAGGWIDGSFIAWAPRSAKSRRNARRALLIDTGRLRRSIRKVRITGDSVTIGSDVPYARAHNEGFNGVVTVKQHTRSLYKKGRVGTGKLTKTGKERMKTVSTKSGETTVRAHTRKVHIKKRQFMGESQYLTRLITHKINSEVIKVFKGQ